MRAQAMWRADKNALPSEMVSLSERLSLMLIVRIAIVAVALASQALGVEIEAGGAGRLIFLSVVFIVLSLVAEVVRRVSGGRGLVVIGVLLMVDGLYLGWATYATGGATSPLRFLLYGHLIAVTLLASYRTGLKIALWHSLLVFVSFYAQLAGFLDPVEVRPGSTNFIDSPFHQVALYNLLAFWFVAIATAVFSAYNERSLRRRGFDLEALSKMAAEMDQISDTSRAMRCLVDIAADTFYFSRAAALVLVNGKLTVVADHGCEQLGDSDLGADPAIAASRELKKSVALESPDPLRNSTIAGLFPQGKQIVMVPLVVEDVWVGVLAAEPSRKRRHRIDATMLSVIEQFAAHAALALSNVWLLEKVQRLAETDSLTGVANRMMFDRALEAEMNRAGRNGESLGLVMIDIDHFKPLNDRYGHQAGDTVLANLAAVLKKASRNFDTVARYGGEEFALILPAVDEESYAAAAERIRGLIETMDSPIPITASVGVASFPANALDPDSLVKAADDALYESKNSGRNRVTISSQRLARQVLAG